MVLGYVFRYTKSNTGILVILLRHCEALDNELISMVFKMAFSKPEKEWLIVIAYTGPLVVKEVMRLSPT